MTVPKFNENEMKVVGEIPSFMPGAPGTPLYDFPMTRREAMIALYKRQPVWEINTIESGFFTPQMYPDNVARSFVFEANMMDPNSGGGKDMFGIEWVYVPQAGGSMVKPGSPLLKDANEWKEKVVFPDIDKWDWAGAAKANEQFLNQGTLVMHWIMNGYFERLISFMDFEGAALALIDEDQQDAVAELMMALTDLYIKIVDKYVEYFHAEAFCVHDDWGSQQAPFFSPKIGRELIVPAMRKLTDHIHSKGCIADFHCCGHVEQSIPNMIAAGWDSWSGMPMNNSQKNWEEYGDQILIGVIPDQFGPNATEEEQRAAARAYVAKFCDAKKPSFISFYGAGVLTPIFREELYRESRKKYSESN